MKSNSANTHDAFALLGRILIATVFIFSGIGKLAAPSATMGYIAYAGFPAPVTSFVAATALELGGGLLLVIGYQTRLVATLLAIYSIATALVFHHAFGDQNQMFHFLKNLAIAGGLIQVLAFGANAYSFDRRRQSAQVRTA
ncbi:DoxX family protein [Paraburkholderia sp. BR10937]|uniref:DoxX family protein n=1 Tax=Paraburkholderia sp. BR10937 TaxID=3236994 RepID=UPI0034D271FE